MKSRYKIGEIYQWRADARIEQPVAYVRQGKNGPASDNLLEFQETDRFLCLGSQKYNTITAWVWVEFLWINQLQYVTVLEDCNKGHTVRLVECEDADALCEG